MKKQLGVLCLALVLSWSAHADSSITATACQRYPWNGMVDIDCTVEGLGTTPLAFLVKDNEDGRYLPVKSLTLEGNSFVNGASTVSDGTYRFIWNAAADVEAGYVATNITLSVLNGFPCYMAFDLSGGVGADAYPVEYFDEIPGGEWSDEYKTTKLVMRRIPGQNNQQSPFYVGVFEVTQKQYQLVTGSDPASYKGDARPVENVSWSTITQSNGFIDRMRKKAGWRTMNLPSEAQWEYACRAGTTTSFNNGTLSIAGLGRCYENKSDGKGGYAQHTKVGSYLPNAWGLYDMHGNVAEWTTREKVLEFLYGGGMGRILKGGSWAHTDQGCLSRAFDSRPSSSSTSRSGFRLIMTIPAEDEMDASGGAVTSLFDTTHVYDGQSHSIDVEELNAVRVNGLVPGVTYALTAEGPWQSEPIGFVDVCSTSIWYKLSVPNFEDYVHEAKVSITPKALEEGMIGDIADVMYTGSALEPAVSVTDGDPSIISADDYTVAFENNVNVGTATAVVTGMRNYAGVVRKNFAITPKPLTGDMVATANVLYTGSAITPPVSVTDGMPSIISADDYTVTYENNVNPGMATVVVTGTRNYTGSVEKTFEILKGLLSLEEGDKTYLVIDLSEGTSATNYPVTMMSAEPEGGWSDEYKTTNLVMRLIPGQNNQQSPFYVGVFEVTQKQYELVMGSNPSEYKGDARPVENVSYYMITQEEDGFIDCVRKKAGLRTLNLPSKSEWEYACRAGTTSPFNNGTSSIAGLGRYNGNTNDGKGGYSEHTKVGSYLPNAWGLYDMHGNVMEWTTSWNPHGALIALCGGGWDNNESFCTSSFPIHDNPTIGYNDQTVCYYNNGFRLFCADSSIFSLFDATHVYDGQSHSIDVEALNAVRVDELVPSVSYALTVAGPWQSWTIGFVDVCSTSVWYKLSVPNYEDYVHEAKVTITPKALEEGMIGDIADVMYTGSALEPPVSVTDGDPSIIAADDYTVTYENNVNPGTATAVVTGTRNYTGVVRKDFAIIETTKLKGTIKWRFNSGTGTYFAQLKLEVESGNPSDISGLDFVFADRMQNGKAYAQLWDSANRAASSLIWNPLPDGSFGRYVSLNAAGLADGAETFGLSNATLASTKAVPAAERVIELYVKKRVSPVTGNETAGEVDNFVGYVTWVSAGTRLWLPIVEGNAGGNLLQMTTSAMPPPSLLNVAAGLRTYATQNLVPECQITDFTVVGDRICGRYEVSALRQGRGRSVVAELGSNARIVVYGAKTLSGPFVELKSAAVDPARCDFSIDVDSGYMFFKLVLKIDDLVE